MKKIKCIGDLSDILHSQINSLESVPLEYMNDTGVAALSAYRAILWHLRFYDDLRDIVSDGGIQEFLSSSEKHPEYLRIVYRVDRIIEQFVAATCSVEGILDSITNYNNVSQET